MNDLFEHLNGRMEDKQIKPDGGFRAWSIVVASFFICIQVLGGYYN